MKQIIYTITCLLVSISLNAQKENCGTPPLTAKQKDQYIQQLQSFSQMDKNTGMTCLPIKAFVVRESDGTGGVTTAQLTEGLTHLNYFYQPANIEFFYCGDIVYVNNSDLYDLSRSDPDERPDLYATCGAANDAINVYYVGNIDNNVAGFAYLPTWDSPFTNRIVMKAAHVANTPHGTYVHEFGHYFDLLHTHQGTEAGNVPGPPPAGNHAENVPRTGPNANCDTDGDALCDTEADPRYSPPDFNYGLCQYTGTGTDINGLAYSPPVENIMSYYPSDCGGSFTSGQHGVLQGGLAIRQGHTTYDFSCTPASINAPSNLTASLNANENGVDLNWTDNAGNEIGYIIERSTTSSSSGFRAIISGFTDQNGTSFTDLNLQSNMDYWYRVKAANGNCDTYSNTASMSTGTIYCSGSSEACDEFISRVRLGSIDNASLCGTNGYERHTNISTGVNRGNNHPVIINIGPPAYNNDVCGIWVDWNQDGDFEDPDESIAVTTTTPGNFSQFEGTITPPVSAVMGSTRMRIRVTWNTTLLSCGEARYGEVEDYTLNILEALPIELSRFYGKQKEKTVELFWETASEINNDYFEVEHSIDGKQFDTLGKIKGKNKAPSFYSLVDMHPRPGTNYYRLKQYDYNGDFDYSKVISAVYTTRDKDWMVYPNPVKDELNIYLPQVVNGPAEVRFFNSTGQLLYQQKLENEQRTAVINCEAWPNGVYYINLHLEEAVLNKKFVKY